MNQNYAVEEHQMKISTCIVQNFAKIKDWQDLDLVREHNINIENYYIVHTDWIKCSKVF
jgi:hypothetical protein